jgi:hypothetical protein
MDCEPFEADNGPSDDDTEMGIEENKEGHTRAKKRQTDKRGENAQIRKSSRVSCAPK